MVHLVSIQPGRIQLIWSYLAICAGGLSFWLPETNNEPMTTTIDEFETKYGNQSKVEASDEKGIENPTLELEKF